MRPSDTIPAPSEPRTSTTAAPGHGAIADSGGRLPFLSSDALPSPGSDALPSPGSDAAARRRRRRMAWGGFGIFLTAFAVGAAVWGLPWSRDRLALWLVVGLLSVTWYDLRGFARGVVVDWLPLFGLLFAYDLARGYADGLVAGVYVWPQLRIDEWLFGGTAPTVLLQQSFWHPAELPAWYDYAAWAVYTSHFFVPLGVAAVLWRVAYTRFRHYVSLFVALTLAGFATYVAVPAMPPWLASAHGFLEPTQRVVPMMWRHVGVEPAAMIFEGGNRYANDVAALPSLHAAYPLLLLLFFWSGRGWLVRGGLAAYVLAMGASLVYGAEHYVSDILLGWLYAVAAWMFVGAATAAASRRRRRQQVGGDGGGLSKSGDRAGS